MLALVWLLLSQTGCVPQESTAVCFCKQGSATACEAVRQVNPELAERLESALHLAMKVEEAAEEASAKVQSSSEPEDPSGCKGQQHHVISRPIAKALGEHRTLHDQYKARDPRFVTRAVDEPAHCGYQDWHREVDAEVIRWLRQNDNATPKQFEGFLRELYGRALMRARFPHGF